jgi:glutamate:Na+ symporter, ESS family
MQSVFLDFGIVSILLVAAHLIRASFGILQRLYIPSPIIAGVLGLLLSPQVTNRLQIRSPFAVDGDGQLLLSGYPNFLVALLFGSLFLGARPKDPSPRAVGRRAADTFFYNLASQFGQYGLALLIGLLVLQPLFPGINQAFALMLPGGFAGGHGTVTAISTGLEKAWPEVKSVGYTFATIGLLSAVIGGMALVNIATRRGWTRLTKSAQELPAGVQRGFLDGEERQNLGQETVSPIALDPLGWHIALLLAVVTLAFVLQSTVKAIVPADRGIPDLPLFAVAVLVGGAVQQLLNLAGLGRFVDRRVVGRLGSTASDYLVVCGMASIKLYVVHKYAVPIVLMSIFGVVFSMAILWYVGRRIYHNFWFERSIFVYGWNTGVVATAIILLRVVDPRLQTRTLEDYGISYVLVVPLEIALLVLLPWLVGQGIILLPAIVLVLAAIGCVLLSRLTVGWFNGAPDALRDGEAVVIAEQISGHSNIELDQR